MKRIIEAYAREQSGMGGITELLEEFLSDQLNIPLESIQGQYEKITEGLCEDLPSDQEYKQRIYNAYMKLFDKE